MTQYFTDAPIIALGDHTGCLAPIRRIDEITHASSDLIDCRIQGVFISPILFGAIYTKPVRGSSKKYFTVSKDELRELGIQIRRKCAKESAMSIRRVLEKDN